MTVLIAEACANHGGSLDTMKQMASTAAECGADVIKFQSWRADKLSPTWPNYESEYQYYKQHELSYKDHESLLKHCENNGIEFLTTIFDLDTVDFLASLGLERVKIASSDCNSWKLIEKCLANFDHVIISTGMHSGEEIMELAKFLGTEAARCTIMHCVSLYPCPLEKANLLRIAALNKFFPSVGYSDHTVGTDVAKVALALGVAALEKHFMLDMETPSRDWAVSIDPAQFHELSRYRETIQKMMYSENAIPDQEARRYIGKWGDNK